MIASFFRHLDKRGVRWLLVSGQATILYGAATFSEDIELWVEPSEANLQRLLSALGASHFGSQRVLAPVSGRDVVPAARQFFY